MICQGRPQFTLRSLLATMTWAALVIAVCVGQQQAAKRQRAAIERLKAAGLLPLTLVGGQPVPPLAPSQSPPSSALIRARLGSRKLHAQILKPYLRLLQYA